MSCVYNVSYYIYAVSSVTWTKCSSKRANWCPVDCCCTSYLYPCHFTCALGLCSACFAEGLPYLQSEPQKQSIRWYNSGANTMGLFSQSRNGVTVTYSHTGMKKLLSITVEQTPWVCMFRNEVTVNCSHTRMEKKLLYLWSKHPGPVQSEQE